MYSRAGIKQITVNARGSAYIRKSAMAVVSGMANNPAATPIDTGS